MAPASAVATPEPAQVERTPDGATYTVRLHQEDAVGRRWTGTERITFSNTGASPLDSVHLRLWPNGPRGCSTPRPLVVSEVRGGTPRALRVHCTDLAIRLASPLAPGDVGTVSVRVRIAAPVRRARFGSWHGRSYLTNALPILAVREDGTWQRSPYVGFGESFSSLTADWDVRLDHPRGVDVPATGSAVGSRAHGDRVTTHVRAARVRDFAWAAGRFSMVRGTAGDGTVVREWYTSHDTRREALRSLREEALPAMDRFGRWFADYPYREVDVVDVDWNLGGMEYPGFVMSGLPGPTVHELAHQWFYALVGNDEYADPWLDESFAQYANFRFYGHSRSTCRGTPSFLGDERISDGMDVWVGDDGAYFNAVYSNGPCALLALRDKLGSAVFDRMLREYVAAHEYGVATTPELKAAVQEAAGDTDLTRFWNRWRIDG
ncbi:M1 family metallopeptidase [Nocardioides ungokensis]|uniref:M1 family metallopeptidase n=1 Tax=Nocardioides ungokensis TaxID=1643322 RepID=UPI0015DE892E|nr:M1 family metallopeptidase [Nocardioides ungokensis]